MINGQNEPVAAITGANAGIGLALTQKLLSEGWQVIAFIRSNFPADDKAIQEAVKRGSLRLYQTDNLADYSSLKSVLEQIKRKEQKIDVLFNNAGGSLSRLSYSKQGRENHYELMTVVPYIIMMELKELIERGHLKTVINTSSSALKFTKTFSIEQLERPATFRKLLGPYAASKLALSLWTQAIAPRLANDAIHIRSVDPGGNNTLRKGKPSGLPPLVLSLMKLFFPPPSHGANRLYEGAFGRHRNETGVFLLKNKVAKLSFTDQAPDVLKRVHALYEHEFCRLP